MSTAPQTSDITTALEQALQEPQLTREISLFKTYPNAPNPGLVLPNVGPVGLPLSIREAQAVKAGMHASPASRTGAWQLESKEITLENSSRWKEWIQGVSSNVYRTLGVDQKAVRPRCVLKGLYLYETIFQMTPEFHDAQDLNQPFATLLVVLPSKYTGGQIALSHNEEKVLYDCGAQSSFQTSVVAAYTGMTHEAKPITDGFCLVLAYHLICTSSALPPSIATRDRARRMVCKALATWEASPADPSSPDRIIYLLEHKYPQEAIRVAALRGVDIERVVFLDNLANDSGLSVGLGSIICYLAGKANDSGQRSRTYSGVPVPHGDVYKDPHAVVAVQDLDDERKTAPEEVVDFAEITARQTFISSVYDVEGKPVGDEFTIDEHAGAIPSNLTEVVAKGSYDIQEYRAGWRSDNRTNHISWLPPRFGMHLKEREPMLERWYQRTALVIWPNYAASIMVAGGIKASLERLGGECLLTETPTPEQSAEIDFLLKRFRSDKEYGQPIVDALCHAACKWRDLNLWNRALESPVHGVQTVSIQVIADAVRLFGFEKLKPSLEGMILQESQDWRLSEFFAELDAKGGELTRIRKWAQSIVAPKTTREAPIAREPANNPAQSSSSAKTNHSRRPAPSKLAATRSTKRRRF